MAPTSFKTCDYQPTVRYIYVDRSVDCAPDPETERAMQNEIEMLKRQLRAAQQQIFALQRQRR